MKRKTTKYWALILVCALIAGILPMGNASAASGLKSAGRLPRMGKRQKAAGIRQ